MIQLNNKSQICLILSCMLILISFFTPINELYSKFASLTFAGYLIILAIVANSF